MFDHVGVAVEDYARSRTFYDAALSPLGYGPVYQTGPGTPEGERHCGYGSDGKPAFWIGEGKAATKGVHVAFTARDRAAVRAFYAAALAAGGRDNGAPGLRPHYHPTYYGAFVLDPEGNNIEAVCHLPE
jgi:catechol 2,3-dioxygenase-like lactoylglutathione lyase family enzyme